MSKAIIVINTPQVSTNLLGMIKSVEEKSLMEIKKQITVGEPIAGYNLFYNDHDEAANKLKLIINALKAEKVPFSIYELDEDAEFTNSADVEVDKIDEETLLNILDSHSSRY